MRKQTRNKLLISGLVAMAGMVFVVYSVLANSGQDKSVDELMQDPSAWMNKKLRVRGYVEPGSIKKEIVNQQARQSFILERNGKRLHVENTGPAPDTFVDQAEVSASGQIVQRGDEVVLLSNDLSAKCPSKYEGARTNLNLASQPKYQ
jgi:cytochrome c-type biogenesis protein CcmE